MISTLRIAMIASLASILALVFYRNLYHTAKTKIEEAEKQISSLSLTIESMQSQQKAVAEIDQKYTEELTKANEDIEKLRTDLATGRKRLYVKATCPKLPEGAAASGMGNATPTRLGSDAEQDYLLLKKQVKHMQSQLEVLQEYSKQTQNQPTSVGFFILSKTAHSLR